MGRVGEQLTEKDLHDSRCGLVTELSQHDPGGAEENYYVMTANVSTEIRT
jgi:hypothetical protein